LKVIQILIDLIYFIFGIDVSIKLNQNILKLKLIKRTPVSGTEKVDISIWKLNVDS
jgi:hypothetical protein